jgi:tetratricopeptide (TPR) repeat protein
VNLKDCPPFASFVDTNLPAETRTQFQRWFDQGRALETDGKFAEAALAYGRASALNTQFAEAEFRLGGCEARLGDGSARDHFQNACDLDALPFRTDSRLNTIIRQAASDVGGTNMRFLDSARLLVTNNMAGVPGQETFYEHVHFNFDGSYRLARLWAEQVSALLPSRFTQNATESWASQALCERHLGLTDWNRLIVVKDIQHRMEQPPLSGQSNNSERLETLRRWEANLRHAMDPAGSAAARQIYREAIKRSPDDYCLYESFGSFLAAGGDIAGATAQWQRVRELVPEDYLANFRVGELLAQLNKPAEAEAALLEASRLRPFLNDAWTELGKVYSNQGQYQLALKQFEHALALQPLDVEAWFQSGIALSKSNHRSEAVERYRRALRINPGFWQAHFELGGQLGLQGNIAEAKRELEQAVQLQPGFAPAHLNLGVALMKERQWDSAAKEFEEALRLDPANQQAPNYLAQVNALRSTRQ